jgi:hypothetical protein
MAKENGFGLPSDREAYWQGRSDDVEGDRWASGKAGPSTVTSTAGSGDSDSGGSRTISAPTGNARSVVGLMGVAMIFSVIGAEVKALNPKTGGSKVGQAFSEPFVIIGGGTIATTFLVLIAGAGETGRNFAVGLSALAAIAAVLVNGGPVWTAIDNFLQAKPTTPSWATAPSSPSTTTRTTTTARPT